MKRWVRGFAAENGSLFLAHRFFSVPSVVLLLGGSRNFQPHICAKEKKSKMKNLIAICGCGDDLCYILNVVSFKKFQHLKRPIDQLLM